MLSLSQREGRRVGRRQLVAEASAALRQWPLDVVELLVSFVPILFGARYLRRIRLPICECDSDGSLAASDDVHRVCVDEAGDRLLWTCVRCRSAAVVCCRSGTVLRKWRACLISDGGHYQMVQLQRDCFYALTTTTLSVYDVASGACVRVVPQKRLVGRPSLFGGDLSREFVYSSHVDRSTGVTTVTAHSLTGASTRRLVCAAPADSNGCFVVTSDQRVYGIFSDRHTAPVLSVVLYELTDAGGRCCWESPAKLAQSMYRPLVRASSDWIYVCFADDRCAVLDFWSGELVDVVHPVKWSTSKTRLQIRNTTWAGEKAVFQYTGRRSPWVDVFY